jgi:TolA-binding protein
MKLKLSFAILLAALIVSTTAAQTDLDGIDEYVDVNETRAENAAEEEIEQIKNETEEELSEEYSEEDISGIEQAREKISSLQDRVARLETKVQTLQNKLEEARSRARKAERQLNKSSETGPNTSVRNRRDNPEMTPEESESESGEERNGFASQVLGALFG